MQQYYTGILLTLLLVIPAFIAILWSPRIKMKPLKSNTTHHLVRNARPRSQASKPPHPQPAHR